MPECNSENSQICIMEGGLYMGNTQRRKAFVDMLTLEGLIAVLSLSATMFALGYAVGSRK